MAEEVLNRGVEIDKKIIEPLINTYTNVVFVKYAAHKNRWHLWKY